MKPPDHFTPELVKTWKQVLAAAPGHPQASAVEAYCLELHRWRDAERWIKENGGPELYLRDDKGVLKNVIKAPQLQIAREAQAIVVKLARALRLKGQIG